VPGSSPIPLSSAASKAHQKQGPFPPPALPGFNGTTSLSATHRARPVPRGLPVDPHARSRDRASRVASTSLLYACHRQYPGGISECVRRSLARRQQPSPKSRSGRLPHHPFRDLLDVHSRYGLHTRQATLGDPYTEGFSRLSLCDCSDCFRLERQLPDGICTHWDAVPSHGAREIRAKSPCTALQLSVHL